MSKCTDLGTCQIFYLFSQMRKMRKLCKTIGAVETKMKSFNRKTANVTHQRHLMITNMENYQKVTDLYLILCDEEEVCCECKLGEIILCIL